MEVEGSDKGKTVSEGVLEGWKVGRWTGVKDLYTSPTVSLCSQTLYPRGTTAPKAGEGPMGGQTDEGISGER